MRAIGWMRMGRRLPWLAAATPAQPAPQAHDIETKSGARTDTAHPAGSGNDQPRSADRATVFATVAATLLLRFASRVSFSLLVFALGQRFASATLTVVVLEVFYLSELALAPLAGVASDRVGRKPFLLAAPVFGCLAALVLLVTAAHFPPALAPRLDARTLLLFCGLVVGRLLEGATSGLNAPAALGALTDATIGFERLRVRALTAFEVATIAGLALAIPFGGTVSAHLGLRGFLLVVALYLLSLLLLAALVTEASVHEPQAERHALRTSLAMVRLPTVRAFLPAWCGMNAIAGIWITLGLLVMTYPDRLADRRFPHQLLYGGFNQQQASLIVGGFGVLFLVGMGLWSQLVPRLGYMTPMLVSLAGLGLSVAALTAINHLGGDPASLPPGAISRLVLLIVLTAAGVLLLGGFPPAALSLVASWTDRLRQHEGAIMGVFAFGLGVSQLLGTVLGGMAVDRFGLYGLIGLTVLLGAATLASILMTQRASTSLRPAAASADEKRTPA